MSPDDLRVVLTTAPSLEDAKRLARGLVEAQLCACVNLVPGVLSIYRWNGAIEEDSEVQLVMKTTQGSLSRLELWLAEHHPYDVPEFVVLVADGSDAYHSFVRGVSVRD